MESPGAQARARLARLSTFDFDLEQREQEEGSAPGDSAGFITRYCLETGVTNALAQRHVEEYLRFVAVKGARTRTRLLLCCTDNTTVVAHKK